MDEKKTDHINVRLPESTMRHAEMVAALQDMCVSAWARSLIEREIEAQRKKFIVLSNIFGSDR